MEGECSIRGCSKDAVEIVSVKGEDRAVCPAHYAKYTHQEWQPKPEALKEEEPAFSVDVKSHDTPGQVLELEIQIREAEEQLEGWKSKKKALQDELRRIVDQERDRDEDQKSISDFAGDADEAQGPDEEESKEE